MNWTIIFSAIILTIGIFLYFWKKRIANLKQFDLSHIEDWIPDRFDVRIFNVTTDDGYILQLFNVRSKEHYNPELDPLLFQHGLGSSAASYLICEIQSPAYVMADKGCDVYIANNRGTVYSLKHETHDTSDRKFWDYSFQDLVLDQKANLKFINERTGGKKTHFFGHSQGAVQMFAGLADDDRELAETLSEKIQMFHALAPVIYTVRSLKLNFSNFNFLYRKMLK